MISPFAQSVRERLDAVIAAMQVNGVWDTARPDAEAFEDMGAFGMNSMAFVAWLRWVFIPRVESLIDSDGPWPTSSQVGVQATREGDTDPVVAALAAALHDFDRLFS